MAARAPLNLRRLLAVASIGVAIDIAAGFIGLHYIRALGYDDRFKSDAEALRWILAFVGLMIGGGFLMGFVRVALVRRVSRRRRSNAG